MNPLAWLLKLKTWAIEIGAIIAAILGALVFGLLRGRKDGANSVIANTQDNAIKAAQVQHDIQSKVESKPEGSAQQELRDKWSRD